MFKNYLKIAVRNLFKFKTISIINIVGLAVGTAVCILILLYIQDELSYDRYHQNADRLYRVLADGHPYRSPQFAETLKNNFPEIEEAARLLPRGRLLVQYKEKQFNENNFTYADVSLFKIFSFKLKQGDPQTALQKPFSIVISEIIAQKYFGAENPIGKTLRLENEHDYTVSAVMAEIPHNSHFHFDIFATLVEADKVFGANMMQNWGWENFPTYLLFQDNFSKTAFEAKCGELIAEHRNLRPDQRIPEYSLQNIKDIHLYSGDIRNDIEPQGDITYVLIFSAIAVLILLIACFNYINLLTANATTRANEIGIKKVIGATRKQLAGQFIGESIVILIIASALSFGIVELCMPMFNSFTGKYLSLANLFTVNMIIGIIGINLITGFIAGGYPAIFLSALQPLKVMKDTISPGASKFNFRQILVCIQFTISIILIISAIFMFRQLHFLQNKKLGFNKEYIVLSEVREPGDMQKYELLKNVLLQNSNITSVSSAYYAPSDDWSNWTHFTAEGHTESKLMRVGHVNFDYFETLGIDALYGRLFSKQFETDVNEAIILNESAVKQLGLPQEPIGKQIRIDWPYSDRKIVGIIKDIHLRSLYEKIQPVGFAINYNACKKLIIKIKSVNIDETLKYIEKTWTEFYPNWVFEYNFLDEQIEKLYEAERRTFQLMGYFTFLAIFVACLGLFGVASFTAQHRTKEIGIRKVLGASIPGIISMLSKDFTKWVLIANIIAWPFAWFAMNKWLQNFAYHISLDLWNFYWQEQWRWLLPC